MASPQRENGYTAIANELLEALAGIRIAGEARQVVDVVFRKTYGFNKKEDRIALSQFSLATGMARSNVVRAINKAAALGIIIKKDTPKGIIYRINKDFERWKPLSKKIRGIKKDNRVLSKKIHTKETITKEIRGVNPKAMKKNRMGSYREDASHDSYEEAIDLDTGEKVKTKRAAPNKEIEMAIAWAEKLRGKPFMNPAQQERALKVLIKNKVPAQKIKDKWHDLMVIPAFRDKGIDFWTILNQLDKQHG